MCQAVSVLDATEAGKQEEQGLCLSKGASQAGSGGQWDRSLTAR